MAEELFWADQIAKRVIEREKFHFIDKPMVRLKEFTVKTSASLSGVLHIGRLSDTIRGESVYRALNDAGVKARFIWVAEDMDPMRKVPKGVPKKFEEYIGVPVTSIPDPDGCHKSYAEHFKSKYFEVVDEFVDSKMKKFSMMEEYKKGNFKNEIKRIVEHTDIIIDIQNKFRKEPLVDWVPFRPICENCGKISTPKISVYDSGKVEYKCEDYKFEKTTAKGCGHEGEANIFKGEGKLMWKSEWAAQWSHWKVVSEGAGKEYQVPNSAWWVNGEILEKVMSFPMPEPIFYEHIMVDNVKMSASLGNVAYPSEFLDVADAEILRFFYNKRLMKTRSFSWKDMPIFYDDFDYHARVYNNVEKLENKKEVQHMKRLYEISALGKPKKSINLDFAHAVIISQIFEKKGDIIKSLEKTGHYQKENEKEIFNRLEKAKKWLEKYASEESRFVIQNDAKGVELNDKQKEALKSVSSALKEKDWDEKELHNEFYNIFKEAGLEPAEFFQAFYQVLLRKDRGPKLAGFVLALGKDRVVKLLEKI